MKVDHIFFIRKQELSLDNDAHDIYGIDTLVPPESYLIFSQEVSNCLNLPPKARRQVPMQRNLILSILEKEFDWSPL